MADTGVKCLSRRYRGQLLGLCLKGFAAQFEENSGNSEENLLLKVQIFDSRGITVLFVTANVRPFCYGRRVKYWNLGG